MKRFLILFAALLLIASCEKEIKLNQTEIAPRIVVNSSFEAGDTVWIQLTESRNILFENELPNITNATAKFLDGNGAIIGSFTHVIDGYYYCSDILPEAGNVYGVSVEAPNMTAIKAYSETPSIIAIATIDTTTAVPNNRIEFGINFTDNESEKNYYSVSIIAHSIYTDDLGEEYLNKDPWFTSKEIYIVNKNADIDGVNYGTEFLFSDENFNGQSFSFKGSHYYHTDLDHEMYYLISLKSVSEDLFKYKVSYSKYQNSQNNIFAEPVQVYSNIENGFGIFGGASIYSDTLFVD